MQYNMQFSWNERIILELDPQETLRIFRELNDKQMSDDNLWTRARGFMPWR